MVSKGGEEKKKKKVSQRRALLQDEQMAESKCGDLFYISIPCRGAGDVGFRFFLFFLLLQNVILQDNGYTQCLS